MHIHGLGSIFLTKKIQPTNALLGGGAPQHAPPMVWHKTKRRHHRPWCGGDAYALTWGVVCPQVMVWAKAAGRHGWRKTWCEWWNRGCDERVKSIVAYGTFSTSPSQRATSVSGLTLNSYTPFMSTFHSSLPKNSISKYFNLFATLFFVPHLIVVIIKLSHFYVTTILLPFPLRNHFSNTSPK